ncbi:MAG: hypothetical protein IT537_18290 [Hyphomicrobiales bacterium]|nr:hypothetical protein [Hyphomicrobiales bacterium]
MRGAAATLALAVALALAALTLGPRAVDSAQQLATQDDPVAISDRALARRFDAAVAAREIEAALAADDPDLARSFVELAQERNVAVDAALQAKVEAANSMLATATRSVTHFAHGLVTGESNDPASRAGTMVSDLLVIGDLRDIAREGSRLAAGQPVDDLILAMAWAGPLTSVGTYASGGVAAPVRVGLTVVKTARRSGRLGGEMSAWVGQAAREVVDWAKLRGALAAAGGLQPTGVIRAVRAAVRPDKAQALVKLAEDVGHVQAKAGTQAALDGLKLARGPRDMSRVAALAAAKGGKTRAILKLLGRGAIMLTVGAVNLASWMFWALISVLGLISSLKRTIERFTERGCARRRRRRARRAARAGARTLALPLPGIGRSAAAARPVGVKAVPHERARQVTHAIPARYASRPSLSRLSRGGWTTLLAANMR